MRMLGLSSLFAAILLGPACGDSTAGSGETGTCPVGSVTCPCTSGGACDNGLVCLSNLCVDPGSGSTDAPTQASGGATASSGSVSDSESAPTTAGPSGDPVTTDISTSTGGPTTGGDEGPKLDVGMKVSGIAFEGKSKTDRPFSVTALSATEAKNNKDLIDLDEPQAEIELSAQTWIAVTAEHGIYDRKLDKVDLNGAVTVYHDNGLTFSTDQAKMDLKTNTASGDMPVTGKDETRELSAEGFEMLDDGATVLFKGRSYLKILPKGKGSGE